MDNVAVVTAAGRGGHTRASREATKAAGAH